MKVTYVFLALGILTLSCKKEVETQVFYQNGEGPLYSKKQVDSITSARTKIVKDKGVDMVFRMEVVDTLIHENNIIYKYSLKGESPEVTENVTMYKNLIGKGLPDFSFKDIDGNVIESKNLIGKPLVINMWFTTCAPCIAEMPELNRLKKENPDVNFIAMTFETEDKVKSFLTRRQFNFTHIANVKDYCEKFTQQQYPINIFVNKDGIIKEIEEGMPLIYNRELKEITNKVNPANFEKALTIIK